MTSEPLPHEAWRMSPLPEPSDWVCKIGDDNWGITYRPVKNGEPNWFWRKMQYLCFGFKWVKEK